MIDEASSQGKKGKEVGVRDLCAYVSTQCKQPSELNYERQYRNPAHFSFSTGRRGPGGHRPEGSGPLKPNFDPLDIIIVSGKREIGEGMAENAAPTRGSAEDFVYVAFQSEGGCRIRIRLKIIGELKPDCIPSPSTSDPVVGALRHRQPRRTTARCDQGPGREDDEGDEAAELLHEYLKQYQTEQRHQAKEKANWKNYVQDNAQAQLIYTPEYIQEKLRLSREIEDFKLQMARKKKQALESEAQHKYHLCR